MGFSYFYINSQNGDGLTFVSCLHMLHLYQHLSNQTKCCWAFWLTNHNQEEGKSCSWKQMAFVCILCNETQSLQPLSEGRGEGAIHTMKVIVWYWNKCVTILPPSHYVLQFSSVLTGRRTLYTWSRSKASRHCESSRDSSGSQTERKCGDWGQEYGFSPVWILIWAVKVPDWEKDFVHLEQEYGDSALLVLWCVFTLLDLEKDLPQTGQGKRCSPVWVRWCDFKLEELENVFGQILQWKGFSPKWVRLWCEPSGYGS